MAAGETVRTITLVAGPVVDASGAVLVDAGGSGVEFVLATNADVNARIADAAVGGRLATFSVSPDGQAQKKLPNKLMKLALFRHGCDWQKLMSFSTSARSILSSKSNL